MSIEALVSGVLLKGVSKLVTSMFHRAEKTPASQGLTKKNDSHDVSDKGTRIDRVFNYYQKQLFAQLQPPTGSASAASTRPPPMICRTKSARATTTSATLRSIARGCKRHLSNRRHAGL